MNKGTALPYYTRHEAFSSVPGGIKVFAVQQGVPVLEALQQAAMLLDTSVTAAQVVAHEMQGVQEENKAWTTIFLLESVQALLAAAIGGLEGEAR